MSQQEQARLQVLNSVLEKRCSMVEAASLLRVSEGHGWRLLAAYRREGAAALAHGNRGRQPPHSTPGAVKGRVQELAQDPYAGRAKCQAWLPGVFPRYGGKDNVLFR